MKKRSFNESNVADNDTSRLSEQFIEQYNNSNLFDQMFAECIIQNNNLNSAQKKELMNTYTGLSFDDQTTFDDQNKKNCSSNEPTPHS